MEQIEATSINLLSFQASQESGIVLWLVVAILIVVLTLLFVLLANRSSNSNLMVCDSSRIAAAIVAKAYATFESVTLSASDLEPFVAANYMELCHSFGLPVEGLPAVQSAVSEILQTEPADPVISDNFLFEGV